MTCRPLIDRHNYDERSLKSMAVLLAYHVPRGASLLVQSTCPVPEPSSDGRDISTCLHVTEYKAETKLKGNFITQGHQQTARQAPPRGARTQSPRVFPNNGMGQRWGRGLLWFPQRKIKNDQ